MTSPSRTTDSTSATTHPHVAYNLDAVLPGGREDEVGGIAAATGEVSVRPHTQQLPGWSRLWLVVDRGPTFPQATSSRAHPTWDIRTGTNSHLERQGGA
jgi:hypothetical protein